MSLNWTSRRTGSRSRGSAAQTGSTRRRRGSRPGCRVSHLTLARCHSRGRLNLGRHRRARTCLHDRRCCPASARPQARSPGHSARCRPVSRRPVSRRLRRSRPMHSRPVNRSRPRSPRRVNRSQPTSRFRLRNHGRRRRPRRPPPRPKVGDLTPDMGVKSPPFEDLPHLLRRPLDPRRLRSCGRVRRGVRAVACDRRRVRSGLRRRRGSRQPRAAGRSLASTTGAARLAGHRPATGDGPAREPDAEALVRPSFVVALRGGDGPGHGRPRARRRR
jgi:hypothetical protein